MSTSWVHDQTVESCAVCPYAIRVWGENGGVERADCWWFCDSQMTETQVSTDHSDPPPQNCPLREGPVTLKIAEGV